MESSSVNPEIVRTLEGIVAQKPHYLDLLVDPLRGDLFDEAASNFFTGRDAVLIQKQDRARVLAQQALRRIENDSYGKCVACLQDIAARRLEVLPMARYCVKCQELEEKGLLRNE